MHYSASPLLYLRLSALLHLFWKWLSVEKKIKGHHYFIAHDTQLLGQSIFKIFLGKIKKYILVMTIFFPLRFIFQES